jgi:hypothetical protein
MCKLNGHVVAERGLPQAAVPSLKPQVTLGDHPTASQRAQAADLDVASTLPIPLYHARRVGNECPALTHLKEVIRRFNKLRSTRVSRPLDFILFDEEPLGYSTVFPPYVPVNQVTLDG